MSAPRRTVVFALALILLALAGTAVARVGGGQSYSHGGSSGGGGDDGSGALIQLLIWLLLRHPAIGVPVLIVVILVFLWSKRAGFVTTGVGPARTTYSTPPTAPRRGTRVDLGPLLAADPNFSEPLFVDFVQLVYARAQQMRGIGRKEPLEPWMAESAIEALFASRQGLEQVRDVIFGATRIVSQRMDGGFTLLGVEFESNLTEVRAGTAFQLLCTELWAFRRAAGVLSPGPERMRVLGCPSCGSPEEPKTDGTCGSCGSVRTRGRAQWEVAQIARADRRRLTPPKLELGGGVEPGVEMPTVYDPQLPAQRRAFETRHPDHSWQEFRRRARDAFLRLQEAWSSQRWETARPFETDALFQVHRFWIERYRVFGLTNRIEKPEIGRIELVKIGKDAYFESVTVRIFATMLDWTEDRDGKIVAGSRTEPRTFTEYWTFLRSIGAKRRPDAAAGACPSCGAPVDKVNMAGVCEYCGSKITCGDFDWVLSRIEQDDAY